MIEIILLILIMGLLIIGILLVGIIKQLKEIRIHFSTLIEVYNNSIISLLAKMQVSLFNISISSSLQEEKKEKE